MATYVDNGPLHQMFRRQAASTPDKIAVVEADGSQLTFGELDKLTDTLAIHLQGLGVTSDRCVGIYMDKCIDYTAAYIAILKAGGAYIPLDISYPEGLLSSIIQDCQPAAVVCTAELADRIKGVENVVILRQGWDKEVAKKNADSGLSLKTTDTTLDSLAYVVYSSGTTGKPKGIACPHRGAVFSYHSRHVNYPYQEDDREASNVFFVWEMLRPLLKGIPMYIIPGDVIYDPPLLCDFIEKNKITRMLFTPSLLEAVLNSSIDVNKLNTLRTVVFCGEVVTTALFEKCQAKLLWTQFLNLYSVSECHDIACEDLNKYFQSSKEALTERNFCPVGRVIPGVEVVILNEDMKPQPVGASGEIYVGGPTLARGYLNRPEVQAKRFIARPDSVPVKAGPRLYRSGDWGYLLSDGRLEICGRCDSMVKIRGYSIELQAVEAALMDLPQVHSCVVLAKGEEGQDKFLVSYIVTKEPTTKKELRAGLKIRLPFYMIPSYFVFLSQIPVVPATGKLDKEALPPFDKHVEEDINNEGKPNTETEVTLATIWGKILQIKDPDIMESFFDLGGHSLLATQLINDVSSRFDIKLSVQDLFMYPTIASLGSLVDAKRGSTGETKKLEVMAPTINLTEEVKKHDQGIVKIDMQLRAFWRTFAFHNANKFSKGRVLLTGATGFLGSFVLKELLLQTKTIIYCLVRELPDSSPTERLKDALRQFSILPQAGAAGTEEQTLIEDLLTNRVAAIKGDVALVNMGMSEDEYTYICTDIDFVVHAAASVNLVYPYSALHGPNVMGTANVILFASSGKIKPIHYISTDAVFPDGFSNCAEDDTTSEYSEQLKDGYSQSKWVAEQLVQRAGQRGMPVTIYRLGNMSGDRMSASWNPQDFTLIILRACIQLGQAPDVDWDMEMTPVDFAAKFIVRMTHEVTLAVSKTFHLINDRPLKARWVFEWMNAHGYPLNIVPFEDWRSAVLALDSNEKGIRLLQSLLESYIRSPAFFTDLSSYKADQLHKALAQVDMTYPYTDNTLLQRYFSQLQKRGVISSRARSKLTGKPLEGRVAIVTGASSGIGKAIAMVLAEAGAKVAMAARRIELLKDLEAQIVAVGGLSICVKTDVTTRENVKELVRHTEMTLGPVDILVNNAGVMYYTMMKNLLEDQWDTTIDVNVKGWTNCVGAVLDGMLSRKKGHIVSMSSDAGRRGFPGLAVYSGTKFYVEGVSQALRNEVAGSGVRVTCIQPGDVQTELIGHTTDQEAKDQYDCSSKTKVLEPQDVANAVLYAVTQPEYVAVNEILIEPREGSI